MDPSGQDVKGPAVFVLTGFRNFSNGCVGVFLSLKRIFRGILGDMGWPGQSRNPKPDTRCLPQIQKPKLFVKPTSPKP